MVCFVGLKNDTMQHNITWHHIKYNMISNAFLHTSDCTVPNIAGQVSELLSEWNHLKFGIGVRIRKRVRVR